MQCKKFHRKRCIENRFFLFHTKGQYVNWRRQSWMIINSLRNRCLCSIPTLLNQTKWIAFNSLSLSPKAAYKPVNWSFVISKVSSILLIVLTQISNFNLEIFYGHRMMSRLLRYFLEIHVLFIVCLVYAL